MIWKLLYILFPYRIGKFTLGNRYSENLHCENHHNYGKSAVENSRFWARTIICTIVQCQMLSTHFFKARDIGQWVSSS